MGNADTRHMYLLCRDPSNGVSHSNLPWIMEIIARSDVEWRRISTSQEYRFEQVIRFAEKEGLVNIPWENSNGARLLTLTEEGTSFARRVSTRNVIAAGGPAGAGATGAMYGQAGFGGHGGIAGAGGALVSVATGQSSLPSPSMLISSDSFSTMWSPIERRLLLEFALSSRGYVWGMSGTTAPCSVFLEQKPERRILRRFHTMLREGAVPVERVERFLESALREVGKMTGGAGSKNGAGAAGAGSTPAKQKASKAEKAEKARFVAHMLASMERCGLIRTRRMLPEETSSSSSAAAAGLDAGDSDSEATPGGASAGGNGSAATAASGGGKKKKTKAEKKAERKAAASASKGKKEAGAAAPTPVVAAELPVFYELVDPGESLDEFMDRRDRAVMTSVVLDWGDRGVTAEDFYVVLYLYNFPDTSVNEEETLASQRSVQHIKVGLPFPPSHLGTLDLVFPSSCHGTRASDLATQRTRERSGSTRSGRKCARRKRSAPRKRAR